jgi:hypothetical protein
MPSNGDAIASSESKAEEMRVRITKKGGHPMCPLPLTLARAVPPRSVVIQSSIWFGTKLSKMPSSQTLKLQTSKTGFKLRTCLHLANDSLR